jgi:RNA polymerase sigma-70 factor (ECF subfamily)
MMSAEGDATQPEVESEDAADEAALVDGLRRGDERAGDQFYARFSGPLYTFIFYRVSGNEEMANDMLQDTFLAAIDAIDRYRPTHGLLTWLRGIARHKIIDYYRVQTRRGSQADWELVEQVEGVGDIEGDYEVQESREETLRVLRSLPPHYQQVLSMKYLDGSSQIEIAAHMGHTVEAIESLLARARRAFRNSYGRPDLMTSRMEA